MPIHPLYRTANSLPGSSDVLSKLVTNSSVIVIGTIPNNESNVVRVNDQSPSSSSSSVTNVQGVGNTYNVQVELYLKGGGSGTLPIIQFVGLDYLDRGQTKQARDTNENLLPVKNRRYLLFLSENGSYPGYWSGTAHPYKFLLADGMAKAESPVGDLGGALPDRPEAEFIKEVEGLVARTR